MILCRQLDYFLLERFLRTECSIGGGQLGWPHKVLFDETPDYISLPVNSQLLNLKFVRLFYTNLNVILTPPPLPGEVTEYLSCCIESSGLIIGKKSVVLACWLRLAQEFLSSQNKTCFTRTCTLTTSSMRAVICLLTCVSVAAGWTAGEVYIRVQWF
jgi:hypothetical protein